MLVRPSNNQRHQNFRDLVRGIQLLTIYFRKKSSLKSCNLSDKFYC